MLKLILKFTLVYFFLTNILLSAVINKIDINGNKRISKDSIIIFSKIDIGSEYSDDLLNNSLKNLYDTNFFENIEISFDQNTLLINVIENPIIEELKINGVEKILEFLKENIYLKERMSIMNFFLIKILIQSGIFLKQMVIIFLQLIQII